MRTHVSQKYIGVTHKGFALPSVLIASVVMLIVLTVAVSATAAIRTDLMTQYYTQLAQAAGEAGVSQAVACLQANNDVPTWSNSTPLTPQTNCSGTVVSGYPTYLVNANNVQSTYSVGLPTTDNQGYATTIPSVGSVQLLRSSTGAVWKTYSATVARSATPTSTCSSGATAAQGWTNASVTTYGSAQSVPNALPISPSSTSSLNPGPVYYRKDFNITTAGTYTISMTVDDSGIAYIDGSQVLTSGSNGAGATESGSVTLSAGCHTVTVNAVNAGITINPTYISLTIAKGSSAPIVASDTSWLVTVGPTDNYSQLGYWQDSAQWQPVHDFGLWNSPNTPWPSSSSYWQWSASGGDMFASYIATPASLSGNNYPASSYSYYRNPNGFYLAASTSVKLLTACDDACQVFLDGSTTPVLNVTSSQVPTSTTITIPAGWHTFGVALYNAGSSPNPSSFLFDALNGSTVLMRSDSSWYGTNFWNSSRTQYFSYDTAYTPTPSQTKGVASVKVLVVAGGGGGGSNAGGGGGGGGVIYNSAYSISPSTYTVTVGGGGAGSTTANTVGTKGANSTFGALTALGGGGGAPRDVAGSSPTSGGSGGGGSGGYTGNSYIGASGTASQGNSGGNGTAPDAGCNATGAGGGGAGSLGGYGVSGGLAGDGGAGFVSFLMGVPMIYGAGGAGSITCAGPTKGSADSGAGAGTGANGSANQGGGGGGQVGSTVAGAGGSGIVIISFPTGSITVSATGAYTTSTFGTNTIYKFTGNGTFTVSSVNI